MTTLTSDLWWLRCRVLRLLCTIVAKAVYIWYLRAYRRALECLTGVRIT